MRLSEAVEQYAAQQTAAQGDAGAAPEASEEAAGAAEEDGQAEADPDGAGEEVAGETAEADGEGEAAEAGEEAGEESAGEGEGEEEPEVEIPEAPASWPADRADEWASLSEGARDVILRREAEIQHKISSEAGRRAAEAKRQAEALAEQEKAAYAQKVREIDALLPRLADAAKTEFDGVDWVRLAQEDPAEFTVKRARFEEFRTLHEKALSERNAAMQAEMKRRNEAEFAALLDRNPQYQGEKGATLLREENAKVSEFARSIGYTEDQLSMASARDYEILRDAMNFRNVKKAAASPAPRKPAPAPKTTVKPAPRKPAGDVVIKKRLTEAEKEFNKAVAAGGRSAQIAAAARLYEAQKG